VNWDANVSPVSQRLFLGTAGDCIPAYRMTLYSGEMAQMAPDQSNTADALKDHSASIGESQGIPVTKLFAQFVSSTAYQALSPRVKSKLKELLLDYIGVASGAAVQSESSGPILTAIKSLDAKGSNTAICKGRCFTAPYAALLNGTFGHSFDFDDTHLAGVLHPGVSVIPAALAEAETRRASGEELLTAIAVGYEVTCRLGLALSDKAYARGFHNTATAGIFGAVSAIAKLRNLPAQTVEMAFGIAGSKAAGSMQYLENGSWNKRLHPGLAAHDAFLCVALAEAGVLGATKILEGKFGFLHAYTTNEDINYVALTRNFGLEWAFLATALKPFPGCRMTHTAIEVAGTICGTHTSAQEIEKVTVLIKPAMWNVVGVSLPNKIHPQNEVDAQFSIYYQTAVALLDGSNTGWQVYSRMRDQDVHDLLDKITVLKDDSFESMETRLTVQWKDGTEKTEMLAAPLGEDENPFSREQVVAKYMSLAGPVYGEKKAKQIMEIIDAVEVGRAEGLMALIS
jgi:2-methylcitrate dehydratase PrpD